jgi:predicted aconitase
VTLQLTPEETDMFEGRAGEAPRLAMKVMVAMADVTGANRLIEITRAHIDGGLYHGRAGLDWAERLAIAGARVAVPTTLNVSSLDLLHPELYRGDRPTAEAARRLMDLYVSMGCRATWTCAPYQLTAHRPATGEQIAWAESNAIVFANSVLGARTERYGDFIDICAAITGRALDYGLHRDENRAGQTLFRFTGVSAELLRSQVLFPVLGHLIGQETGRTIPVIDGLPSETADDDLKALGAAAASSGSVALFHAVGVTPEAPTLDAAFGGRAPKRVVDVTPALLVAARDSLTTAAGGELRAISVGTPHASAFEIAELARLMDGATVHDNIDFYVSTGRDVLEEAAEPVSALRAAGARFVVDTCTYITPIIDAAGRVVMTNSAKWAYYAPANLGIDVVFGSTRECVQSGIQGHVWRDDGLWRDV